MGEGDQWQSALVGIKAIAQGIVDGSREPLRAANEIYWAAWLAGDGEGGAWDSDEEAAILVSDYGAAFVQMLYSLERNLNDPFAREAWEELIRGAAVACLEERLAPGYRIEGNLPVLE